MDTADIYELVRRISYKPGWRFTVGAEPLNPWESLSVGIEASLPNSRLGEPDTVLVVGSVILPPTSADKMYVMESIRRGIRGMEYHEVNEWLAVDGLLWEDPHNSGVPVRVRR